MSIALHAIQDVQNEIEKEIRSIRQSTQEGDDRVLWKTEKDRFSDKFITSTTWRLMRTHHTRTD